jgi:hypothetical protein
MTWRRQVLILGVVVSFASGAAIRTLGAPLGGQEQTSAAQAPSELVRKAVANEVRAAEQSTVKHFFKSRKQRGAGSQTKLYVQTVDAMAGLLIANDDKPLSPEQTEGEHARLKHLIEDRDDLRHKAKQEHEDEERTLRIVKALPDAFLYEYDGQELSQPGIGKTGDQLVRLKFHPNSNYVPPSHVEQVLAGMEGYLLIDKGEMRLAKIDARLFRDVSFGWGILGHLDKGGTFTVTQSEVGAGDWELTGMGLNLTGKILLFKTIAIKSDETFNNFRRVPDDTTFAQGVDLLEAEAAKLKGESPNGSSASGSRP